jgi:hypothetical protein
MEHLQKALKLRDKNLDLQLPFDKNGFRKK